jgi:DNA-binding CsgD family transcriptional regulator
MSLGARLRNPLGLTLILVSLVLAGACAWHPDWLNLPQRLGTDAAWLLLPGVLAYLASIFAPAPALPEPKHPAMRNLLQIRHDIAARLTELRAAKDGTSLSLVPIVSERLRQMDEGLVPKLREIVRKQQAVTGYLTEYEQGTIVTPDLEPLERLRAISARFKEAINICVQQAANAYATLLALTLETDERNLAEQARLWAADLQDIYDGLTEVLRGTDRLKEAIDQLSQAPEAAKQVLPMLPPVEHAEPAPPPQPEVVPDRAGANLTHLHPDGLTTREVEVLRLIALGKRAKEIADELVVSIATVQRHTQNIYNKIGARGRSDATRYALTHGIVSVGEKGLKFA